MRRSVGVAGLGLGLAAALGCGDGPGARRFAVTLLDATTIDCRGIVSGPFVTEEELDTRAKEAEASWADAHAYELPARTGNVLYLAELETETQAWLEAGTYDGYPSNTNLPGTSGVYVGPTESDHFQGSYADLFNSDESDEALGLAPCGDRARASGELAVTLVGKAVEGRVRWTAIDYLSSAYSSCDGRVECARDLDLTGLAFAEP
ncbi:MAG: hypothetical protein IT373_28120 [Polyangiaceae bacterium]|nr:hypothetical protein [Polyangiaceae bacterium]